MYRMVTDIHIELNHIIEYYYDDTFLYSDSFHIMEMTCTIGLSSDYIKPEENKEKKDVLLFN